MKKVKICGLTRQEDIVYVNQVKPDYVGFVFAKSKRQVTKEQAILLRTKLDPSIAVVGVFVNADKEEIKALVEEQVIDIVQLHGEEDAQYIQALKQVITVPIIKAIKVESAQDLQAVDANVAYYLLDNKVGGSGEAFDWSWIPTMNKPYFLAGGIALENISNAVKIPSYGVDISSGVEVDGKKNKEKIEEIVRRVRDESR